MTLALRCAGVNVEQAINTKGRPRGSSPTLAHIPAVIPPDAESIRGYFFRSNKSVTRPTRPFSVATLWHVLTQLPVNGGFCSGQPQRIPYRQNQAPPTPPARWRALGLWTGHRARFP